MWQHRGQKRPDFAIEPGPGQESVWDYPRPPALVNDQRLVEVYAPSHRLARSRGVVRVLETASPPSVYIPPEDVVMAQLVPAEGQSFCEWKGRATYWALRSDPEKIAVGWSYANPTRRFSIIAGWLSFYPGRVSCSLDGESVRPQQGGFYGGWITSDVVGPFKGEPGTLGW